MNRPIIWKTRTVKAPILLAGMRNSTTLEGSLAECAEPEKVGHPCTSDSAVPLLDAYPTEKETTEVYTKAHGSSVCNAWNLEPPHVPRRWRTEATAGPCWEGFLPRRGTACSAEGRVPITSLLVMHLRGRVLEAAPGHGLRWEPKGVPP